MATNRVLAFLAIRLPFSPQIRLGIETEGCAKMAFLKQSDPADLVRLRQCFWGAAGRIARHAQPAWVGSMSAT
jgi:hypothetical protein